MKRLTIIALTGVLFLSHSIGRADPQYAHKKVAIPDTVAGILRGVDERLEALDRVLMQNELSRVHQLAFEARDLLLALPPGASLTESDTSRLESSLKKIKQQASLLDKYGDAGNARMTKVILKKFKEEIDLIKQQVANQ